MCKEPARERVTTNFLADLLRRFVGFGRPMSIAECAERTGFAARTIESWVYGENEPRAYGLWCLAEALGDDFKLALAKEWLGMPLAPQDELNREIGELLTAAGLVVKKRAA